MTEAIGPCPTSTEGSGKKIGCFRSAVANKAQPNEEWNWKAAVQRYSRVRITDSKLTWREMASGVPLDFEMKPALLNSLHWLGNRSELQWTKPWRVTDWMLAP